MVDRTFVTMPYDFTIELMKIGGLERPIEITENGSYDVRAFTKANVGVYIPRCTLNIVNNSSYRLGVQSVNEYGRLDDGAVRINSNKSGTVYGLLDYNTESILNYIFGIFVMGKPNLKVASADAVVSLGKVYEDYYVKYACMVLTEDGVTSATLVFTDA